jgi:hypothetical protein
VLAACDVAALLACWSAAERWAKAVTAVVPTSGDRVVTEWKQPEWR